ncbi:hypothetical protein [Chryseobacterium contaminans]
MSRTRIVKGIYTKISEEGHSMYSKGSIITTAEKAITENGEKGGVSYGNPKEAPIIKAKLTNTFKGKAIFKLINPLPIFVAQDYNKASKTFSNVNRPYLPYGFDWYRDDWETLVSAKLEIANLSVSDFTRTLAVGHSASDPKPEYNVVSPNHVKVNYKIAHRIIDGVEKLIEYSVWAKLSGTVSIASSDTFFDDPNMSLLAIAGESQRHQFEELNLITGRGTGVVYKSDDADLTNFNRIKSTLGSFGALQTMKLLSSLQEMKKEYSPVFLYSPVSEKGSMRSMVNSAKSLLEINEKEYLTPWYAAFNTTENEVLLDIVLDGNHSATGKVKIMPLAEDLDKISLLGDIETQVNESHKGTVLNKKVKIKFINPISNHSVIEVRFFDDNKASTVNYVGEIIGLLNVYKNDIEYKLNVQYVDVKFKGKIDKLPCDMTLSSGVTKLDTLINFNTKSVTLTNPNVVNGIATINKTSILNSTSLETYVKGNVNLFNNTLNQSLIKTNILPTNKTLEIDFLNYNFNHPPSSITNGIDLIKRSLLQYSEYNDFTLRVNSDELINGLIREYIRLNGQDERGILIFLIPFTIVEYSGLDSSGMEIYDNFKGRVDQVAYESKYLILARSLLEENAKEVPAHEAGHSLALHHPFVDFTENSNRHHFIKNETLNVMDYPKLGPDPSNPLPIPLDFGIYLYKYQWDIMLGDVRTPTQRGDLIKINATNGKEIS